MIQFDQYFSNGLSPTTSCLLVAKTAFDDSFEKCSQWDCWYVFSKLLEGGLDAKNTYGNVITILLTT